MSKNWGFGGGCTRVFWPRIRQKSLIHGQKAGLSLRHLKALDTPFFLTNASILPYYWPKVWPKAENGVDEDDFDQKSIKIDQNWPKIDQFCQKQQKWGIWIGIPRDLGCHNPKINRVSWVPPQETDFSANSPAKSLSQIAKTSGSLAKNPGFFAEFGVLGGSGGGWGGLGGVLNPIFIGFLWVSKENQWNWPICKPLLRDLP